MDMESKRKIAIQSKELPITTMCDFMGLNRSSFYYVSAPKYREEDFEIMGVMGDIFTDYPFFGHRQMWQELIQERGYKIGRDRTLKFMKELGLKAICPGPETTIRNKSHQIYPYLLRDLDINRPNQVWCTDITYVPVQGGFCYLVAIMDWYSKKILSYRVSNSMDVGFCIEALEEALLKYPTPEIFNTDQGSQFTSESFTSVLKDNQIQISMDGKGRATDNIAIERFWRTIKYENIYLFRYQTIKEVKAGINKYIDFYNYKRKHSVHGYQPPSKIHGLAA